jgi:peptide/nickel transport system substrate-binding protein
VFAPAQGFSAEGAPLRIVLPNKPDSLDPHLDPTWVGDAILANVYDSLLTTDAEGELVPVLATSWERDGDQAWIFKIRDGVVFHDGTPLQADDVAASIDRVSKHPKSQARVRFNTVEQTVVVDSHTVRVELKGPDAVFLKKLVSLTIVAVDVPEKISNPIGTGAYRFVEAVPGESVQLEVFPEYWGDLPSEQAAEFLFDEDLERSLTRLIDGEVDMVANLTPESLPQVEDHDDLWVDSAVGSYVHMLALNEASAPFSDDILREAVEQALDRPQLASDVFLNHARPAGQLISETNHGYAPDLEPVVRNLPRARALVTATTENLPVEFTLEFRHGHEQFAAAIDEQLKPAGFKVQLQDRTYEDLLGSFLEGKHQAALISLRVGARDVGLTFDQVIHSGSPLGKATKVSDPSIDRLIVACRTLTNQEERLQLLHGIAHRIAARRVLLPMVWAMDLYGVRRELEWKPLNNGTIDLKSMSRRVE